MEVAVTAKNSPVQQDDDILGGTLVFTGTRVPVHTLIAYLSANDTIDDFLDDFPTVSREQVIDYLFALAAHTPKQPS